MKPFFIGLAGGSGSGKTTLAEALKKKLGKRASVFHADNYQRFGENIKNWDSPGAVDWQRLYKDLRALKRGQKVIIEAHGQRKLRLDEKPKIISFIPTEIVIIAGHSLFYKKDIRKFLDFLIYLEAGDATRLKRRTKQKHPDYVKKILLPMHRQYIEPTKKFADMVFDTENYSISDCCKRIESATLALRR